MIVVCFSNGIQDAGSTPAKSTFGNNKKIPYISFLSHIYLYKVFSNYE